MILVRPPKHAAGCRGADDLTLGHAAACRACEWFEEVERLVDAAEELATLVCAAEDLAGESTGIMRLDAERVRQTINRLEAIR